MQYLFAALMFAYLGNPAAPVYAAEPLTIKQMEQVTAGAVLSQFDRYRAYARTVTDGVSNIATATNSNVTVQRQGSGG
jgi:hypothetical protein